MHILEYSNFEIIPTEEAMLIKPIRDLYNKDKSAEKEKFLTQMAVVYFLVDPRSSFNYILDENERLEAILLEQGLPKDFKIDKHLQAAIDAYRIHTITISSQMLEIAKETAEKVRHYLKGIDLNAEDDKGRPKVPFERVLKGISEINKVVNELVETEKKVNSEIEEKGKARGNAGQKTIMDDGIIKK